MSSTAPIQSALLVGELPTLTYEIPDREGRLSQGLWEFQVGTVIINQTEAKKVSCALSCSWLTSYQRSNLAVRLMESPLHVLLTNSKKSITISQCSRHWFESNNFSKHVSVTFYNPSERSKELSFEGSSTVLLYYRRKK